MAKYLTLPGTDGFERIRPGTMELLEELIDMLPSSTEQQSSSDNLNPEKTEETKPGSRGIPLERR